ncbi:Cys 2 peroxiredoxin [Coprinopsis cinerea okayama7|uniref:thioredoxin-dependent peroxiredoxin n=1 Tax=Coprinopsis cinerea (strain Okayama-7 / 130 / ATCC MYA-4618 / FGSC 9003) TaxID=240176 RepID=A8P2C5_COPC7|nr:Cys 2 peroxiredoxin [Coprinopsis cinerea okayama7\|eukprot:XP_001838286.2 Cys 2 peroxiredoxin [Coprinopsis cinerea okayama7\
MPAIVQRPAPTFKAEAVTEGLFNEVSLQDYQGKWVVLFFYPIEILAFNDALPQFQELNTVVLGVSTDSKFSHFAWATQPRKEGGLGPDLKLPLIADRNMKISRDYGVLLEDEGIALRGLFIIDPKGILRQITVNDLPVGRSVDETIRLIKAFQFTEKYGEVCPANWTEGSKTIKTDPVAKLEYFGAANGEVNGEGPKKRPRTE